MTRPKPTRDRFPCPNCGAEVPLRAKACRECGSDADTGWQSGEEIDYQSLDLPEGYATDPDHPGAPLPQRRPVWVALVAVVVALLLLALAVLGR